MILYTHAFCRWNHFNKVSMAFIYSSFGWGPLASPQAPMGVPGLHSGQRCCRRLHITSYTNVTPTLSASLLMNYWQPDRAKAFMWSAALCVTWLLLFYLPAYYPAWSNSNTTETTICSPATIHLLWTFIPVSYSMHRSVTSCTACYCTETAGKPLRRLENTPGGI